MFSVLYVFCCTLVSHPAVELYFECASAECCVHLYVDVHACICVVTVFQLSLLFAGEKLTAQFPGSCDKER